MSYIVKADATSEDPYVSDDWHEAAEVETLNDAERRIKGLKEHWPADTVYVIAEVIRTVKPEPAARICGWFLLCKNAATGTREHPTLGAVPICDRCNEKMDAIA